MKKRIDLSNSRNYLSTIFGGIVAVASAWMSIDWDHFEWSPNNIVKLSLAALIAIGGYYTSINRK